MILRKPPQRTEYEYWAENPHQIVTELEDYVEQLEDIMHEDAINRLAYTQLVIKFIAAAALWRISTPAPLIGLFIVDVLYLQFERNLRGVTAFKVPVVTVLYYVVMTAILYGF